MQVKTILNRVHKFKSFVYGAVRFAGPAEAPVTPNSSTSTNNTCFITLPMGIDRSCAGLGVVQLESLRKKSADGIASESRMPTWEPCMWMIVPDKVNSFPPARGNLTSTVAPSSNAIPGGVSIPRPCPQMSRIGYSLPSISAMGRSPRGYRCLT